MNKPVLYLKKPDNLLEVKICAISDWDGFDKLVTFLRQAYNAVVIVKYDGPDARRWILEINGRQIELIYDDMFGNYLVATSLESEEIVRAIGKDLEERLASVK